jgi:diguanylate cyclase (GGDEF)-like protein/PAS domain S-box-containing protein
MRPRLWTLVPYGIAAKLYLLTAISVVVLAVLATASIHFASETKFAASRLYREGVVEIQKVSELRVLFEQHRALITAAPAELDRGRLQKTRQAVEAVNARIEATIHAESSQQEASGGGLLSQIAVEVPKLMVSGDRVLMLAYNFAQDKALEVSQGDYSQAADNIQNTLTVWYQQQLGNVDREVNGLSKAANDLILWVIAAALTAFVLIGPVTLWAEHRILRRLGKMTAVMHRLHNNELAVDVPFTKALDEIGDIARSIDVFKSNAIALELTHVQLDAALNNMAQGLCMFDAAQRLIVCNKRYADLYGLNEEETRPGTTLRTILQHRITKGNAPDDHENYINDRINEVSANKPYQITNRLHDGRYVSVVHRPTGDGGWVATHEDVTEAKRREESFRLLFDNNPVAMWVFDCETLRFLAVNDAAVAQYGYSRKQFRTMTVPEIRAAQADDSASFLRALPEVQNGEYVGQYQRADGTKIHVAVYSRTLNYDNRDARLVAIHDITDRKLAEDDLHRTKRFLDAVIENVPMPIVVRTANDSRFTLLNKAGEELFGFNRDLVIGKTPYDVYDEKRADFVVAQDRKSLLSDHAIIVPDHQIPTAERGVRLVASKKVAIQGDDGKPEYVLTLIDDVTERRGAEQRIARMAHSDSLTDLPNRAAFNECLASTLRLAEAEGRSFAVLCMDLDGFKKVNDVYGHTVGDSLLRHVADRLRAVADDVFIARLGGDEFTIIADNEERPSVAKLTGRLLAAFADDFEVDGHRLRQDLSIGVATYPADGIDAKTLLNNADAALNQAKAEHPGSVQLFEAKMAARLRERAALQGDLELAIEHSELLLHYQPQLKMTGEITGFEVLARWQSPKRGMVPPGEFIPIAEESSLILLIGEWVLREACREAISWKKPLRVAVNVSPIQFRHGDLPRLVHSVLLETGLAPNRLELEITEGVLIGDFSRAVSILRRLKSLGVQIALDDFGTGYSSLSYLHAFPFDKIKIDRTFISDLETNRHSIAIVRALIGLSRSLNIPILAEGVETQAQHAFLAQEGCAEVQGYLTGRPLAIADYAGVVGRKLITAELGRPRRRRMR